jgi:Uma2 family endonuclease
MVIVQQPTISNEVEEKAIEIVKLLMMRPITEEIAIQVDTYDRFKLLEITGGDWVGFDEDEYMGGERHGWRESILIAFLTIWALENQTGRIYPGDTSFVLDGDMDDIKVRRKPDVGFVQTKRLQTTEKYYIGAPDIAIEITSPTDSASGIQAKIDEFFQYGTQQVWQVYPDTEQIIVHLPDGTSKKYGVDDTIDGGELLSGFELDASKVFES